MTGNETSGGIHPRRFDPPAFLARGETPAAAGPAAVHGREHREDPNISLRRASARAHGERIFGRFFAKRQRQCFLLGRGLRVLSPRCGTCARDFNLPGRGQIFQYVSPIAEPLAESGEGAGSCLFIGSKALVAPVSPQLAVLLRMSVAVFREKVVVAMARTGKTNREPILFCRTCGANLLTRISPPSQRYYGWDWLTELGPRPEPRSLVLQKLSKIGRLLMPIASQ